MSAAAARRPLSAAAWAPLGDRASRAGAGVLAERFAWRPSPPRRLRRGALGLGLVDPAPVTASPLVVVIATGLGGRARRRSAGTRLPRPAVHLAALVAVGGLRRAGAGGDRPARAPAAARRLGRAGRRARPRPVRASAPSTGPTAGDDEWVRLVDPARRPAAAGGGGGAGVLAGAPRPRARCGRSALVALLALYGTAVTEHDPGAPLVRGLVLFLLVAAWLWLPRAERPRRPRPRRSRCWRWACWRCRWRPGSTPRRAVIDYQSWNWFGGKDVTFDWNHSYGPLDWPREGTTLLHVEADRAALLEGRDARPLRRPALGALARERPHQPARRAARATRTAAGTSASA